MSAKVLSAAVSGLNAQLVEVEADVARGLPKMFIVGLPDTAVQEARERVKSGIRNSQLEFPPTVITVNLAPAHLKKEGPGYDLPIAVAILQARGEIRQAVGTSRVFIGELSLDGRLRPVTGILPIALMVKQLKIKELYVPHANAEEAALVDGVTVFPLFHLAELVDHLNNKQNLKIARRTIQKSETISFSNDMSQVRGQEHAKRALEIAAAGGHNILMTGPPGSGKTMLARCMATILPPMSFDESLEITKIYSVAGHLPKNTSIITQRPFRTPHHTSSAVALVGGGSFPKPGEISLAHRGVLFLDEFAEFPRPVLESLRQPLEDGVVTVARAAGSVQFPARFTLVAARNPCPCGFVNDGRQDCICSPHSIINYQKKISGPLLDRIDIHITVPRLDYEKVSARASGESSSVIRQRVSAARAIQRARFHDNSLVTNSSMSVADLEKNCQLDSVSNTLLRNAVNQFYLSARAYHRILKVARTIADLGGSENISSEHIAEALQYRAQDS